MPRPCASLSLDLDNAWSYLKTRGDDAWTAMPSYFETVVPRFLAINDRSIGHYVDIKLEMMDRKPGDKVTMKLLRDPLIGSDRTVDLDVTLAPGQ